jgi:dTDP-glucose pyrophosphorylase
MKKNWKKTLIYENQTVEEVLKNLSQTGFQISLIVNKNKKLVGTITDGDLREYILLKKDLSKKCKYLMNKKPVYLKKNSSDKEIINTMRSFKISQIPILNKDKTIDDLKLLQEIISIKENKEETIIYMAGGRGSRLKPLTNKTPKPMIKIKGRPILEHLINNAKKQGFVNILISTHYLQSKIKNHFKDGKKFNLNIKYLYEKKPLGTAGALSKIKIKDISKTFVVSNSDILSNINYVDAIAYHKKNKADITLLTKNFLTKHKFSIIDNNGKILKKIDEKPTTFVNYGIGVYIFSRKILKYTGKEKYIDMINFIKNFQNKKKFRVVTYPIHEEWRDIGSHLDLKLISKK